MDQVVPHRGIPIPLPAGSRARIVRVCLSSVQRLAFLGMVLVLPGLVGLGQERSPRSASQPSEYEVKAAFLLNFTKFIEWPRNTNSMESPFTICILGEDPFGTSLDQIVEGEQVAQRRLAVRRIRAVSNSCEVLFIGKSERSIAQILAEIPSGVLTVGESDDFIRQGGMIAFAVENRRVRFDIDERAAARGGLKISSKLLNVARSMGRPAQ